MAGLRLEFERHYELPPVIVWDALTDSDLVSGWLAEAIVQPHIGGRFDLRGTERLGASASGGVITELATAEHLVVVTEQFGTLQFDLELLPGGSRGTSTRLTLVVEREMNAAFSPRVRADWLTTLDHLEDLLRGHPVDWQHWDRDHREAWLQHLGHEQNSSA